MKKQEVFTALKIYALVWVMIPLIFFFMVLQNGSSFNEALGFFKEIIVSLNFLIAAHVFFLIVYLLFLIFRFFVRTYTKKGIKTTLKYASYGFVGPVLMLVLAFKTIVYTNNNEADFHIWDHTVENTEPLVKDLYAKDGKHRGMSVFGWQKDNETAIAELVRNHIEWVAVTPFFYQKNERTKQMNMPDEIGKWSRRDSIFMNSIAQLHEKGIHVNLKPHLWMNDGWRSNINFKTEAQWATWFASYRKNMLHCARMAEMAEVELLCIGTELKTSLKNQPEAWLSLISEIKAIYRGKLTYAANWDDVFDQADFWNELDYIGIQAYYPLTKTDTPDLATIKKGWKRHIDKLEALSQAFNKPILFTEIGYKSEVSATIRPWEWDSFFSGLSKKKSDLTQQLAYEALFQELWKKEWFAGTYIWQWDTRTTKESAPKNMDFSPRFKAAENTLAKWYGKSSNQ